ncbi:Response regulator of zinc sigma-54-dependent two-component system [hydrothermal vent metagenome]|uniref:Response regulator of zinc sigma-54-dependent two-component system n=1 Tax=hydrothermal vent metagenome TaxID=652676 RepID=A0A3B1DCX9_9ZZZZ
MRPRLLVVDDEIGVVESLRKSLRGAVSEGELEVQHCLTFRDAEKFIKDSLPDLAVIDLNLPEAEGGMVIDGLGRELIDVIRGASTRTKIIMITGETNRCVQDKYLNEDFLKGVNDFVLKESRTPWIRTLTEKILYLANLFIKADKFLVREISDRIVLFNIDEGMTEYFRDKFNYDFVMPLTLEDAIAACERSPVCAGIVGVDDRAGYTFIRRFLKHRKDIPLVAITRMADVDGFEALKEAMKEGAVSGARLLDNDDYIEEALNRAMELRRGKLEKFSELIGNHPALVRAIGVAEIAAEGDSPVMVIGESGTGKELIAKGIHGHSGRKGEFVAINCAAIPENLIESELFGHERGAFTSAVVSKKGLFEVADRGTLFLDEIAELPLQLQTKLLRVLEMRSIRRIGGSEEIAVDVKVITATNRDLSALVGEGCFRNDLYQRLNVFSVRLPSLRDRKSDIPRLVYCFISDFSDKYGKGVIGIEEEALEVAQEQSWSEGNVRGLRNFIEKVIASIPVNKEVIGVDDVLEEIPSISFCEEKDSYGVSFHKGFSIKDVEQWAKAVACIEHIKEVLREFDSLKVGERERQEVKKRLDIKNDGTFYINIDNGITIAFRIIREQKGHASESDVLKILSVDSHKALRSFILDRINRRFNADVDPGAYTSKDSGGLSEV